MLKPNQTSGPDSGAQEEEAIVTIKLMRDGSMQINLPTEALTGLPEVLEEAAEKIRRELKERNS